jgi:hypothetical protein
MKCGKRVRSMKGVNTRCGGNCIEVKREGSGQNLKIHMVCETCGDKFVVMPNLLIDIFSIPTSQAASVMGMKGGKSKSERKQVTARQNGMKGGRPPKNAKE